MVEHSESKINELGEAKKKIQELEQLIRKKQFQIDYLNTLIEVASEDLGVDLKKPQISNNKHI